MGNAFLDELERTNGFIAGNPYLYSCVEAEMRRTNQNRFPYSLFYVIDGDTVNVLSCFHYTGSLKRGSGFFPTTVSTKV